MTGDVHGGEILISTVFTPLVIFDLVPGTDCETSREFGNSWLGSTLSLPESRTEEIAHELSVVLGLFKSWNVVRRFGGTYGSFKFRFFFVSITEVHKEIHEVVVDTEVDRICSVSDEVTPLVALTDDETFDDEILDED